MRQSFQYVLDTYLSTGSRADSSSRTYQELIHTIPREIKDLLKDREDLIVKGSMGNGNKAAFPWIAIMNRNVTTTTQKGLYIVFLFKRDMSGLYLTLNQGITNFEKLYKSEKYKCATKVSDYFRSEIEDTSFSKEPIYLGGKKGDLGYGYEKANVIQTFYPSGNFSDELIQRDLEELIGIYDLIVKHFDSGNYDTVIQRVLANEQEKMIPADEALDIIREVIDPDGDLPFGYNKKLQMVEPLVDRDNKFSRITAPKTGKIDYLKKSIKDAKTGLLGEELVIQHEQERLNQLGLEEYASKVKWVSAESDAYGYDIQSFMQTPDGTIKEIYIEVKTTTSKVDTYFYVSRNEVERSMELTDRYCVYRVYDVNSISPKFYTAFGKIEDNFILDPVTYMARYKGNSVKKQEKEHKVIHYSFDRPELTMVAEDAGQYSSK
ncbi:MAG: DUF3578 domain-containing protein [Lachnospiraceae bacterium]|nr:DUF3578 domain-containing protein [Lachnospiraceae bacterium]